MTVSISSIKIRAKKLLSGKWVIAIISALMVIVSFFIIQNTAWVFGLVAGTVAESFIALLLTVLLCGPLSLGVLRLFWRMRSDTCVSPSEALYYFGSFAYYHKVIKLCFMLLVRAFIYAVIFYFPAIVLYIISSPAIYDFLKIPIPMWSQYLTHLVDFLSSVGLVLVIFTMLKYYLAPILIIADEEMDVDEAIHMSVVIYKTSFTDFVFLCFSMVFWAIISLLFIPLMFTLPYFIMCYVIHGEAAINDYNERIKKLIDENLPSYVAGV